MARLRHSQSAPRARLFRTVGAVFAGALSAGVASLASAAPASAAVPASLSAGWCGQHGATFARWAGTSPNLAICGPGPAYGGGWSYVDIPGPAGSYAGYLNATPGFQCVELAERFLALAYGFSPVRANGAAVAANYHAAYPRTELIENGSSAAVHHAPVRGDILSLSTSPSFFADDGHVAIVIASSVNRSTGNGRITVAQENVSSADYLYGLNVAHWRLVDPTETGNAEFQFPYAEWLHVNQLPAVASGQTAFLRTDSGATQGASGAGTAIDLASRDLLVALRRSAAAALPTAVPGSVSGSGGLGTRVLFTASISTGAHSPQLVSGGGLIVVLLVLALALVLAGSYHRRLVLARARAAHPTAYGAAIRAGSTPR